MRARCSKDTATRMTSLSGTIHSSAANYVHAKHVVGEQLGASESLLHVHAGLMIFVLTALLLRRRMASVWPVSVVAFLAVLNEVVDYIGPERAPWKPSAGDIANTVLWPVVLFLLARRGSGVRTKV